MSNDERAYSLLDSLRLPPEALARLAGMPPEEVGDLFRRALSEATRATGENLAEDLKRDMPKALRAWRAERAGFEKRLRERWGRAFDLYELVHSLCVEAGTSLNDRYGDQAVRENDIVFHALKLLHGRACVTGSEILALLVSGHPFGAYARWRTLHEYAAVAFLIRERGAELAERFILHQHVQILKDARGYQRAHGALTKLSGTEYEPFTPDEIGEMEKVRDALLGRFGQAFGSDWGWAALLTENGRAPRFVELERLAGLEHLRPFMQRAHHDVHADSKGVALGIVGQAERQVMLAGATNYGLADPGQGALISLHQVTTTLLVHGALRLTEPFLYAICLALGELVREASVAFAAIQKQLDDEETSLGGHGANPETPQRPA